MSTYLESCKLPSPPLAQFRKSPSLIAFCIVVFLSLGFKSHQSFKIPVKLYLKSKKIMVQGTPDCQNLFMRHFKDILVHQEMKGP